MKLDLTNPLSAWTTKALPTADPSSTLNSLISGAFILIGIIAVITLIVGGLQFMLANGDSVKIKRSRQAILYAIIGLVVAVSAYSIMDFVLNSL